MLPIILYMLQLRDLLKEMEAVVELDHPNIVKFVGACLDPACLALVTELCEGGSLYSMIHCKRRTDCLPFEARASLADQVVAGVEFLHTHTPVIFHRDLKSLNVVVNYTCFAHAIVSHVH